MAQHLTNTVFIDRALIVVPCAEGWYFRHLSVSLVSVLSALLLLFFSRNWGEVNGVCVFHVIKLSFEGDGEEVIFCVLKRSKEFL